MVGCATSGLNSVISQVMVIMSEARHIIMWQAQTTKPCLL